MLWVKRAREEHDAFVEHEWNALTLRVENAGYGPARDVTIELLGEFDVAGDLRIALSSTAGPEAPAAAACSWALPAPRRGRLQDFRVGVVLDHQHCPVSSELGAPLSNAVDQLARAGVSLVEGWPPRVDPVAQYESFGFHVQLLFAFQAAGE